MKFILIGPSNFTIHTFRGDLLKKIKSLGHEVTAIGNDHKDSDKIKDLGVQFKCIALDKNGLSISGDLKYCYRLYKYFKENKPDVVLGYTIKPIIYGAVAAKLAGVKNINSMMTGVGYVFTATSFKAKVLKMIVSFLYFIGLKCCTRLILQNQDDLNEFVQRKLVKKEKCSLVSGSGVNMDKFALCPIPRELNFFMIGRVMYCKGVLEYFEACSMLKNKYPHVTFFMIGPIEQIQDSVPEEVLKKYVEDGIIDYLGMIEDVPPVIAKCSVYVLPSYREGTPRSALEAMAMGRPVNTTDAPGCREVVKDGITGFLVPVKDSRALADKMEWFINNQDKIEQMGKAGYEYCKERFEVSQVNKIMLKHMKIQC